MFKKQLPIIFVGLCVVIAVLVLGWSVFVKQEVSVPVKPPVVMDNNNQNGESDDVVDDSSDMENDVVDIDNNDISGIDASDWKTYRNEELGFEIKYLKDSWKISAEEFNDRWGKTVLGYIVVSNNDIKDPFYAPIAITILKNERRLSIGKWYQENYPKEDISRLQKVKFNEVDGMRRLSDWSGGIDSFYFSNEDKIYSISALDLQRNVENQRIMTEKMLSTFKFIEYIFVEDFSNTVYKDDTNTTADWDINQKKLQIPSIKENKDQICPAISFLENKLFIAWRDEKDGNADIYQEVMDTHGNKLWDDETKVNTNDFDTISYDQWEPDIATFIPSDSKSIVVWQDNALNEIIGQVIDNAANRCWSKNFKISSSGHATNPAVATGQVTLSKEWGSVSSDYKYIVWQDRRNDNDLGDIYAQKLISALGEGFTTIGRKLWENDLKINTDAGTAQQGDPAIVADSYGNIYVVWQDSRNGGWSIYFQKYDTDGNKFWKDDVKVDSDGILGQSPSIAIDCQKNSYISWTDKRNGNWDVYSQKINTKGNRLWIQDIRVNSNSDISWQGSSSMVVDNTGSIFIVWEDDRNGNHDIYLQKIDSNGNKLWASDIKANSDIGTSHQNYPDITIDSLGNSYIIWSDPRSGNQDIYLQKITSEGIKEWDDDDKKVNRNAKYLNSAIAQSLKINSTSDIVTKAILTANEVKSEQIWILYQLSADGGIHWEDVSSETEHIFTNPGNDLRWKAKLCKDETVNETPLIRQIELSYDTLQ